MIELVKVDLYGVIEADIVFDENGVRIEPITKLEIVEALSAVELLDARKRLKSIGQGKS